MNTTHTIYTTKHNRIVYTYAIWVTPIVSSVLLFVSIVTYCCTPGPVFTKHLFDEPTHNYPKMAVTSNQSHNINILKTF